MRPGWTVRLLLACAAALFLVCERVQAQPVDARLADAVAWYTGVAGRVDDARAHALLLEAVESGDALSRMWLARCHSRGRMNFARDSALAVRIATEVIDEIERRAASGVLEAVFLMGTARDEGLGRPIDAAEAAAWYRRAAERGHVLAQHNLGNAYEAGRGVIQNDSLAVHWWRRAAEQGDAIPQWRLGTMYEAGRGVPQDLEEARRWYGEAAARGLARARDALDRIGRR